MANELIDKEANIGIMSDIEAIDSMNDEELDDLLASGLSFEDLDGPSKREVKKQVRKFRTKF